MHLTRKPREKRPRTSLPMAAALLLLLCATSAAHPFAGGTGAPDDPFQIATAEQLIAIGADPNLLSCHFVLVDNIDLDPNISPAYLFDGSVIGQPYVRGSAVERVFNGVFDGNGLTIRHLTIVGNDVDDRVGLFYSVAPAGIVKHLVLENAQVSGGSAAWAAGMLCARNDGRIIGCSATGIVSTQYNCGGLVGDNNGVISRCIGGGTISARYSAGGLAASNSTFGVVKECSGFGMISSGTAGGLIGQNSGNIQDCCSDGEVSGQYAGGLVGTNDDRVDRSYSTCQVSGSYRGGLVGSSSSAGVVTRCYFLSGPDNGIGVRLTSDQMKDPDNFDGWDFWGRGNDGFGVPWFVGPSGFPELAGPRLESIPNVRGRSALQSILDIAAAGVQVTGYTFDYDPTIPCGHVILLRPRPEETPGAAVDVVVSLGAYDWHTNFGIGRFNDPYWILSPGQLECLAGDPTLWNSRFALLGDLNMAWRSYEKALIGQADAEGIAFEGIFDGRSHIIENLTFASGPFDDDDAVALGLFGRIGIAGNVYDLGLRGVSIDGQGYDQALGGMLCAFNEGRIARCYSQGSVNWPGRFGGLVGCNAGLIVDCYAQGTVDAENLMGRSDSEPDDGLVGENTTGAILMCYSTCAVISRGGGGLVGENTEGAVIDSLWDVDASGVKESDWGVGLSTIEMYQQASFAGWDFEGVWSICEGIDYPRLWWENVSCEP